MTVAVNIRGIYATALTKFFLDRGAAVVAPSPVIEVRFGGAGGFPSLRPADIVVKDREDLQGVYLAGLPDAIDWAVEVMAQSFFDAVFRDTATESPEQTAVDIEFPYLSKRALDQLRGAVLSTVENHHRLRIIAPDSVDLLEGENLSERAEGEMEERFIRQAHVKGAEIAIEHVKLDG